MYTDDAKSGGLFVKLVSHWLNLTHFIWLLCLCHFMVHFGLSFPHLSHRPPSLIGWMAYPSFLLYLILLRFPVLLFLPMYYWGALFLETLYPLRLKPPLQALHNLTKKCGTELCRCLCLWFLCKLKLAPFVLLLCLFIFPFPVPLMPHHLPFPLLVSVYKA